MIGVHTPEFDFEHVQSNVQAAITRLGIDYPVAMDNDYGTWSAWGNNSWPAEYLIDAQRQRPLRLGQRGRLRLRRRRRSARC